MMVKLAETPEVKVTVDEEVNAVACRTVMVKVSVSVVTALVMVTVIDQLPPLPAAGVPDRVAVPLPLSTKVRPEGSAPDSVKVALG